MNKCIFFGRLANDPEIRYTNTGKAVAEFTLAIDDGYGDNKKTYWPRFQAWEKTAEIIGNNLSKGRKVLVEAKYTQSSFDGKDGKKQTVSRFMVERLEFADSKEKKADAATVFGGTVDDSEEIPF